jgi:hypothetical protein
MASEVRNILSWGKAIANGWQPGHYQYAAEHVPVGTYEVILDFKIWAKKVMAINCYCTIKLTGQKIQLTVYCQETGRYMLPRGEIDFTICPTQTVYLIEVHADQKKKIRFIQALRK